jgi:6-phosphogluconolactonase (cycloisomerase 2 family)
MSVWRRVLSAAAAMVVTAAAAGAAVANPAMAGPAYVQVPGSPFVGVTGHAWSGAFSPTGAFFVTGDFFNSEIAMFRVNPATDALTLLGEKGVGSNPNAVQFAKHSSTTFLGVATDDTTVLFSVSPSGKLTQLGMPASVIDGPTALDFNSAGTRLAVSTFGGVQMYAVGSAGLASRGFKAFPSDPTSIAFNPSGRLLAVSSQSPDEIRMFSVGTNGSLTSVGSPTPTGSKPAALAFNPSGKLLAVANFGDDTVSVFSVDAATGKLTAAGSPTSTGSGPDSLAFNPTGKLLAVSNFNGDTLSLFSVNNRTARLTPVSGSPVATGSKGNPDAVAFSPTGLLAAPRWTAGISVFTPAPPSAKITSPGPQGTFARGAAVPTRFTCADSTFGPGLASCADSSGSHKPRGHLSTSKLGAQTYFVTARSRDGERTVSRLRYFVANAPSVKITAPSSGKAYRRGARVRTTFSCREGASGPGLSACADSNGSSSPHGHLNTSQVGSFRYTVTAVSRDGLLVSRSIGYRVVAP